MASEKRILLVHGAGAKPGHDDLLRLWRRALAIGLQRDAPELVARFEEVPCELFYYADRTAELHEDSFDPALDVTQREQVLDRLGGLESSRDFRRRFYEDLPHKSPAKEFVMDVGASLGLGKRMLANAIPEIERYWADTDGLSTTLRAELASRVLDALEAGSDLLLVTHCLGSVIAYDGLWSLKDCPSRVTSLVTLGSPLAADAVKKRLAGAGESGVDCFPRNIVSWNNLSAEDDFVCHDKTVANDFQDMLDGRVISEISDHTIYNLAVRYGRSNPHHSAGYLVHPRMTKCLADWLGSS